MDMEIVKTTIVGLIILSTFSAIVIYSANNIEKVFVIFLSFVSSVALLLASYAIGYIVMRNI